MKRNIHLLLNDIRSTHNVGAIFRTADAVGVSKIYISGITPAPIDRFGRERSDINKASLGAEKTVAWEEIKDIKILIEKLKEEKFQIIALEQSENSIDFKKAVLKENILLIVGNEVDGIAKEILEMSNDIVEIPMYGKKESLNVSVATGIMLYSLI